MQLRTLDARALRAVYRAHLTRDFPPAERKPLCVMARLAAQGRYDTWGVYEGDTLLAYAFLWHDDVRDYALLDYLAVCGGVRGRGVGTAVLHLLEAQYSAYRGILLEAEAPDPDTTEEENALRLRRRAFYLRAGFHQLGYQAKLFHVVYDMFSSGTADTAAAMETHRRLYSGRRYAFFKRLIGIPYEKS